MDSREIRNLESFFDTGEPVERLAVSFNQPWIEEFIGKLDHRLFLASGISRMRKVGTEPMLQSFLDGYMRWRRRRQDPGTQEESDRCKLKSYLDIWTAAEVLDYDFGTAVNDYAKRKLPGPHLLYLEEFYLRPPIPKVRESDYPRYIDDHLSNIKEMLEKPEEQESRIRDYSQYTKMALRVIADNADYKRLYALVDEFHKVEGFGTSRYLYGFAKELDWPQGAVRVDINNDLPHCRTARFLDENFYADSSFESLMRRYRILLMP